VAFYLVQGLRSSSFSAPVIQFFPLCERAISPSLLEDRFQGSFFPPWTRESHLTFFFHADNRSFPPPIFSLPDGSLPSFPCYSAGSAFLQMKFVFSRTMASCDFLRLLLTPSRGPSDSFHKSPFEHDSIFNQQPRSCTENLSASAEIKGPFFALSIPHLAENSMLPTFVFFFNPLSLMLAAPLPPLACPSPRLGRSGLGDDPLARFLLRQRVFRSPRKPPP